MRTRYYLLSLALLLVPALAQAYTVRQTAVADLFNLNNTSTIVLHIHAQQAADILAGGILLQATTTNVITGTSPSDHTDVGLCRANGSACKYAYNLPAPVDQNAGYVNFIFATSSTDNNVFSVSAGEDFEFFVVVEDTGSNVNVARMGGSAATTTVWWGVLTTTAYCDGSNCPANLVTPSFYLVADDLAGFDVNTQFPQYTLASTSLQECSITQLLGCVGTLFVPSANSLAFIGFSTMWQTLSRKPPLGYFTAVATELTAATTTTAATYIAAMPVVGNALGTLRTGIALVLWFLLLIWIFNRLRHFNFQS